MKEYTNMNPTIYTQLAPLGFAEWLEKNKWRQSIVALEDADNNFNIDSSIRTILNALAFRWLREEKKIFAYVTPYKDHAADNNDPVEYKAIVSAPLVYSSEIYDTHELAEHHALCKALEILSCSPDKQGEQSKGGENG